MSVVRSVPGMFQTLVTPVCNGLFVGSQWRRDRTLVGSSLRSRSYFDDVLTQTNGGSKQLVNLLGSSLSSLKKGEFIDHHELFVPTALKIAMGNNKIKLKIICLLIIINQALMSLIINPRDSHWS
jgi:hypothetical protein